MWTTRRVKVYVGDGVRQWTEYVVVPADTSADMLHDVAWESYRHDQGAAASRAVIFGLHNYYYDDVNYSYDAVEEGA